jgi:hypothetical protein
MIKRIFAVVCKIIPLLLFLKFVIHRDLCGVRLGQKNKIGTLLERPVSFKSNRISQPKYGALLRCAMCDV